MNRRRLIVVLEEQIFLYDISNMKLLHTIDTNPNPQGIHTLLNNVNLVEVILTYLYKPFVPYLLPVKTVISLILLVPPLHPSLLEDNHPTHSTHQVTSSYLMHLALKPPILYRPIRVQLAAFP